MDRNRTSKPSCPLSQKQTKRPKQVLFAGDRIKKISLLKASTSSLLYYKARTIHDTPDQKHRNMHSQTSKCKPSCTSAVCHNSLERLGLFSTLTCKLSDHFLGIEVCQVNVVRDPFCQHIIITIISALLTTLRVVHYY